MQKGVNILILLGLIGALVAIRAFASDWFYDPLIDFFKGNHSTGTLPELDILKLVFHTTIRFWVNTFISLLILWVLFKKRSILAFSMYLYASLFLILVVVFTFLVQTTEIGEHMPLFYVRRFLIHPLLLLLLIPAFYFQKLRN